MGFVVAPICFISTLTQNYFVKKHFQRPVLSCVQNSFGSIQEGEDLQSKESGSAVISNKEMRVLYLLLSLIEEMEQALMVTLQTYCITVNVQSSKKSVSYLLGGLHLKLQFHLSKVSCHFESK